jgi:hypothetical protein
MDVNMDNPYTDEPVSNVFNAIQFTPIPWTSLDILSQTPIQNQGFTEFNTRISFMPTRDLRFSFGTRYIENNDFFENNSQVNFSAFWRINDHWSVSTYDQYEFVSKVMQYQRYFINRDLTSWVASLGAEVRDDSTGDKEYGLLLMMTLKAAPQITLPLAFSQGPTDEPASASQ